MDQPNLGHVHAYASVNSVEQRDGVSLKGPNAREQAITKQIQTLHREGHSFTRIVRELEKRGMFKRKGDPVTSASVRLRLLSTMSIRRQRARAKQGVRGDE